MSDVATRIHAGEEAGKLIVERVQDCTPILEDAARLRIEGKHGGNEMRHAARWPMVVVERYCNERGITFQEWVKDNSHARAMLNDPALAGFRVWEGRA